VAELVQDLNVSRSWLERRFLECVGRSPGEEIRRVRLEHARNLLLATNMPLAQIADACGFDYLSHFSAAYKRHFGGPPSRFRAARQHL
jgi:LacI family transcriptional regulator